MIHRHRNTGKTTRTKTQKNIVYQKKTGRWYVTAKIYAENAEEALAIRTKLLAFINGLVDASCVDEKKTIPLEYGSGALDARTAP